MRGNPSRNGNSKIAIFLGSVIIADDEQSVPSRTDKAYLAVSQISSDINFSVVIFFYFFKNLLLKLNLSDIMPKTCIAALFLNLQTVNNIVCKNEEVTATKKVFCLSTQNMFRPRQAIIRRFLRNTQMVTPKIKTNY
jgi:hypothetical protein